MASSPAADIPYPLAYDDRTRDAVQTIVSGRKSWKTLKGKGEAVWPPYLEAALVEALDKYRPETSRSARSLSRFPNRNRFISDYIYHVTGKRRTAKQVGSRLQQLRDTCGGKRILKLLSSRDFSDEADPTPIVSPPPQGFKPSRALVIIDVLPADAVFPSISLPHSVYPRSGSAILTPPLSPSSPISALPSLPTSLTPLATPSNPAVPAAVTTFHSPFPRPLRAIDPTVTFTSAAFVRASSSCAVYFNGNCVHREKTPMNVTPAQDTSGYVYRVALVPNFWPRLCESNDPGRYSIVQEIVQSSADEPTASPVSSPGVPSTASVLLTVVYQLQEPSSGSTSADASPVPSPSASPAPPPPGDYGYSLSSLCDPGLLQPDLPISPVSATFSDGPQPTSYAAPVQVPAATTGSAYGMPLSHSMVGSHTAYDFDTAAMAWYNTTGNIL
ncbi:hypothetical protein K488DRAFT_68283 [Vararia minispora EC-137]|uniref:Uncharacterized protein n=1 Tax=Vararia minispora EC-137 TaxID=1314806 RepID=A0ACB8QUU5_9AGAM|nr:hypothetical protein K488DRAFT_68283 [Vararia minispora EC-137]